MPTLENDPKDPRNRVGPITEAFNAAAKEQIQPSNTQAERSGGSGMVARSAPEMHLRPDGPARSGPDRQAYAQDLQAERSQQSAKQAEARSRVDAIKQREAQTDKGKDKEAER